MNFAINGQRIIAHRRATNAYFSYFQFLTFLTFTAPFLAIRVHILLLSWETIQFIYLFWFAFTLSHKCCYDQDSVASLFQVWKKKVTRKFIRRENAKKRREETLEIFIFLLRFAHLKGKFLLDFGLHVKSISYISM